MIKNCKILCSITTQNFSASNSNWQNKIHELRSLKLSEIGLFLTGVKFEERKELFKEIVHLKKELDFKIPFVHATTDMHSSEYTFLINKFETENI